MSHTQRQPLLYASQSALIARASTGHEMPSLLQVASDVVIYANGCNIPFQLGLQMTSNIQKSGALVGQGSILVTFNESCMP